MSTDPSPAERERLRTERAQLRPQDWTWEHWRSKGQGSRVAQGLPPDVDPAVLREAGRQAAPFLLPGSRQGRALDDLREQQGGQR